MHGQLSAMGAAFVREWLRTGDSSEATEYTKEALRTRCWLEIPPITKLATPHSIVHGRSGREVASCYRMSHK
jgi:hypothetical protein